MGQPLGIHAYPSGIPARSLLQWDKVDEARRIIDAHHDDDDHDIRNGGEAIKLTRMTAMMMMVMKY